MDKLVSKQLIVLMTICVFILSINVSFAKQIAITFDYAPLSGSSNMSGAQKTQQIIKHLTDNSVPDALFFVTTGNINLDIDKQRLSNYTSSGFNLAKHKYEIGYVTVDNFNWCINSKLLNAQNAGLGINYDKLGQLYVDTLWSGIQFYDDLATTHLKRSPKHVLLLHENELAALYLDKLIQHIRSQGWEIISPQEAYTDPISTAYKSTLFSFNKQGRIAAILNLQGVNQSKLRHPRESTKFIDELFEKYKIFNLNG